MVDIGFRMQGRVGVQWLGLIKLFVNQLHWLTSCNPYFYHAAPKTIFPFAYMILTAISAIRCRAVSMSLSRIGPGSVEFAAKRFGLIARQKRNTRSVISGMAPNSAGMIHCGSSCAKNIG